MKLPKKMQELKSEIQSLLNTDQELWDKYESNLLDGFISKASSQETFNLGWDLGRLEVLQEILNWIEDIETPVYGD